MDQVPSVKGFDLVLAELPRTGFGHLQLALRIAKEDEDPENEDWEEEEGDDEKQEMIARLVASFPESVMSLALFSNFPLTRVPLATHSLMIDLDRIAGMDPFPFAPTLERLMLDLCAEDRRYNQELDYLPLALEQLPASLVHLGISNSEIAGPAIAALART
ncbi:hypothetical protein GGF32_006739 [Allomyces javanicus]|nr:hypothetical protein GGF32_006739 [Allomyces javanicus]